MTARKPIVLVGGSLQVMQSGDTIDSAVLPTVSAAASAPAWAATTAVAADELRTFDPATTGHTLLLRSNSARTTGASMDLTEAANWTVVGQNRPILWATGALQFQRSRVWRIGVGEFQCGTQHVASAQFDTDLANFARVTDLLTETVVTNQATNASVSAADSGQAIAFAQTTASITVTLSSPTAAGSSALQPRLYTLRNTGSASVTIAAGTVSQVLVADAVKTIWWNGSSYQPYNAAELTVAYATAGTFNYTVPDGYALTGTWIRPGAGGGCGGGRGGSGASANTGGGGGGGGGRAGYSAILSYMPVYAAAGSALTITVGTGGAGGAGAIVGGASAQAGSVGAESQVAVGGTTLIRVRRTFSYTLVGGSNGGNATTATQGTAGGAATAPANYLWPAGALPGGASGAGSP